MRWSDVAVREGHGGRGGAGVEGVTAHSDPSRSSLQTRRCEPRSYGGAQSRTEGPVCRPQESSPGATGAGRGRWCGP